MGGGRRAPLRSLLPHEGRRSLINELARGRTTRPTSPFEHPLTDIDQTVEAYAAFPLGLHKTALTRRSHANLLGDRMDERRSQLARGHRLPQRSRSTSYGKTSASPAAKWATHRAGRNDVETAIPNRHRPRATRSSINQRPLRWLSRAAMRRVGSSVKKQRGIESAKTQRAPREEDERRSPVGSFHKF